MDDLERGQKEQHAGKNVPMRSNQWCVAPSRSADKVPDSAGRPAPHWEGLAVMYEARVHAGDLQMNGFFLAGGPTLGIGHNQHVGWALTTGGPDTSDVYQMKFRMGLPKPQYEYDGQVAQRQNARSSRCWSKTRARSSRPALYTHLGTGDL